MIEVVGRKNCIKKMQKIGAEVAKELGYTEVQIGEDRQKGVWGESLTAYLEKKYGECTENIRWYAPGRPEDYVEFDYRFSDPRITIQKDGTTGALASIEASDFNRENWKKQKAERAKQGVKSEDCYSDDPEVRRRYFALSDEMDKKYPTHSDVFYISESQIWWADGEGFAYLQMLVQKWENAGEKNVVSKEDSICEANDFLCKNFIPNKHTFYDIVSFVAKRGKDVVETKEMLTDLLSSFGLEEEELNGLAELLVTGKELQRS